MNIEGLKLTDEEKREIVFRELPNDIVPGDDGDAWVDAQFSKALWGMHEQMEAEWERLIDSGEVDDIQFLSGFNFQNEVLLAALEESGIPCPETVAK